MDPASPVLHPRELQASQVRGDRSHWHAQEEKRERVQVQNLRDRPVDAAPLRELVRRRVLTTASQIRLMVDWVPYPD